MTAMSHLFQKLLQRAGKGYALDPDVPDVLLIRELTARAVQLVRGLLGYRSRALVGARVRVRGRSRLRLGTLASLGADSRIDAHGEWGVTLGPRSKLGAHARVTTTSHLSRYGKGLRIGRDSGIGEYAHLGCSGGVEIGDDVIVGPFLTVHSQEHRFDDPAVPIRLQGTEERSVVVEDDVWIGARVTLLAGSRIGRGSVVAAGAVVAGAFPAHSLIGGVPARRIKTIRNGAGRPPSVPPAVEEPAS